MKKKNFIIALAFIFCPLAMNAQKAFNNLEIRGFDITIVHSTSENKAVYESDAKIKKDVVKNGTLILEFERKDGDGWFFNKKAEPRIPLTLYMNTNQISEMKLKDCGLVYDSQLQTPNIKLSFSAGSDIDLKDVAFENLNLQASSGSRVKINGKSLDTKAQVSSGANLILKALKSDEFKVKVSSGSRLEGDLEGTNIDLSSSSGSDISLTLKADSVKASASSGSDIKLSGTSQTLVSRASSGASINAKKLDVSAVDSNSSSGGSVKVSKKSSSDE